MNQGKNEFCKMFSEPDAQKCCTTDIWHYYTVLMFLSVSFTAGAGMFSPKELPVCPGDEATFSCTVVDPLGSQTTVWSVNTTMDSVSCFLANALSTQDGYSATCGPFTARFGTNNRDSYPSTLTVTANAKLDNAFVQCFGPDLETEVGNGTLQIVGKCPWTIKKTSLLPRLLCSGLSPAFPSKATTKTWE